MEAEIVLYPHTEASFEIRCLMWDFLVEPFDVIIEDLRLEVVGNEWQTASDIRQFYDSWVREQYARLFSNVRRPEGEIDHSNLVSSDGVPSSQSALIHHTSSSIMEIGLINHPRTTSNFEIRRSVRANLTAIFDIHLEHLRFLFREDPDSHVERIQRAILNNEAHHHWDSVTDMYRFYEGLIRAWYPQLFSTGRVTGEESDLPPIDHSGASEMDAMMRNVPAAQTADDAFSEDSTGQAIQQPPPGPRLEGAGMSHSSNVQSFANGNAVTSVAPIDAVVPHPEPSSGDDEAHPRPESNDERNRVLRGASWAANDPESQPPYDRDQRLLFHIGGLTEIVSSSWRREEPASLTSQERRNDSNNSLGSPQADLIVNPITQIRPEGDLGTSNPGGGVAQGGGRSHPTSESITTARGHADHRGSESLIDDFAISHPNIRASVHFQHPQPVPTQRRNVAQRRASQPSLDASSPRSVSADHRQTGLRGAPAQPRVPLVMRPSWWIRHLRAGNRRRDEVPRFAAASGQRQLETHEMPFGRECYEVIRSSFCKVLTKDAGLSLSSRLNDREGEYPDSDAELFMLLPNSSSDASSVSGDESVCSRDVRPRPRLVEDRIGHSQWHGHSLYPMRDGRYSFQTFGLGGYENVEEREGMLRRGRRRRRIGVR